MHSTILKSTCGKLAALAAICVAAALPSYADNIPSAANLVHRWSFNGSYDDTGSGTHQTVEVEGSDPSSVSFNSGNTAVAMTGAPNNGRPGHLKLGANLLPTDVDGVTLEIWAKPTAAYTWARIFSYGYSGSNGQFFDMCWTENSDVNRDLVQFIGGTLTRDTMKPYTLNEMHHISVVFEKDGNGGTWIRWMRRDTSTGEIVKHNRARVNNWTLASFTNPTFLLGGAHSATSDAGAEYDEVRIWNIALSDAQLSVNAKAGPDDLSASAYGQPDSWAEYVSSGDTKERYINTGLIGRSGTKVEAKFRQVSTSSTWPVFIGVDGAASNTRFHPIAFNNRYQLHVQYRNVSNSLIYNPGDFGQDLVAVSDYAADGTTYVVVTNVATGAEVANVTKTGMGDALDTGRPMYLLACNGNTWLSDFFFGRCYYAKIWQTNAGGEYELVRSYVPCVKDGVAGLFDEVSQTIFYPVGMPFEYAAVGSVATASWNGADTNPSLPGNWLCYDSTSALVGNALPGDVTAVTIDRASPAPLIADGTSFHWTSMLLGNTATGALNQSGGSLTLSGESAIGAEAGSIGTYAMSGGTFAASGLFNLGKFGAGTLSVSNGASVSLGNMNIGHGNGSSGRLVINGRGSTVALSSWTAIADLAGSRGEVEQTGGTYSGAELSIGQRGLGIYTQSGGSVNNSVLYVGRWGGTGQYTLSDGGSISSPGNINVGVNAGSVGTFTFEDGTIGVHSFCVGQSGSGTFIQNGGTATLQWWMHIGENSGGVGKYVQNGGTVMMMANWNDTIALGENHATSVGTYEMNGGTLEVKLNLKVGKYGTGTFAQGGGIATIHGGVLVPELTGSGTLIVTNNATLATLSITKGDGAASSTVQFDGAIVKALDDNAEFFKNLDDVTIGAGGLTINADGHNVGITNTLFNVATDDVPPITLTGGGTLDFSGVTVNLTQKPSKTFTFASSATGGITGLPVLSNYGGKFKVSRSADGKAIRFIPRGFMLFVK